MDVGAGEDVTEEEASPAAAAAAGAGAGGGGAAGRNGLASDSGPARALEPASDLASDLDPACDPDLAAARSGAWGWGPWPGCCRGCWHWAWGSSWRCRTLSAPGGSHWVRSDLDSGCRVSSAVTWVVTPAAGH